MIRRTTPNKCFFRQHSASSCCMWLAFDEVRHETTMTLQRKPVKAKSSYNTSTAFHLKEYLKEKNTPTRLRLNYPTRTSSDYNNQVASPTARTEAKGETIVNLPSPQAARNPLYRLQRPQKSKARIKNPQRPFIQHAEISQIIFFNYVTPRKQKVAREDQSTRSVGTHIIVQHQAIEQNQLNKQIDNYKREYQDLLDEQNQLQQTKQANQYIYKTLLANLKAKNQEMRALERLRRKEVYQLEAQILLYIAQREQA